MKSDLTQEEKRVMIAQATIPGICGPFGCYGSPELSGRVNGEEWIIPDYFGDLNACAEMRKSIRDEDHGRYVGCLESIIGRGMGLWGIADATPAQHCEAFGQALSLW